MKNLLYLIFTVPVVLSSMERALPIEMPPRLAAIKESLVITDHEPYTGKTYSEIIEQRTSYAPAALFARVVTQNGVSYCDVEAFNNARFGTLIPEYQQIDSEQCDPRTRLRLLEEVRYFYVHSMHDQVYYLGSDRTLLQDVGRKKLMQIFLSDMVYSQNSHNQNESVADPVEWRQACTVLSRAYRYNFGYGGFVQDYARAFQDYKQVASQTINRWAQAVAEIYLADMLLFSEVTDSEYSCCNLYQKVIQQSTSASARALAHFRLSSDDFTENYQTKVEHLQQAVQQKVDPLVAAYAWYRLGKIYSKKDLKYYDEAKAINCFTQAAQLVNGRTIQICAMNKLKKYSVIQELQKTAQKAAESSCNYESSI